MGNNKVPKLNGLLGRKRTVRYIFKRPPTLRTVYFQDRVFDEHPLSPILTVHFGSINLTMSSSGVKQLTRLIKRKMNLIICFCILFFVSDHPFFLDLYTHQSCLHHLGMKRERHQFFKKFSDDLFTQVQRQFRMGVFKYKLIVKNAGNRQQSTSTKLQIQSFDLLEQLLQLWSFYDK